MAERRGFGDAVALTPEKLAFIQGAKPARPTPEVVQQQSATAEGRREQQPEISPIEVETSQTTKPRRPRESSPGAKAREEERPQPGFYGEILVPLTTRLQPQTADALRRACLEQKLARRTPNTQQEILELALRQWLVENDFLSP